MKICTVCKDRFSGEEISEWRQEHEPFSTSPFMCPDCYDRFTRQDQQGTAVKIKLSARIIWARGNH